MQRMNRVTLAGTPVPFLDIPSFLPVGRTVDNHVPYPTLCVKNHSSKPATSVNRAGPLFRENRSTG
ncbi:hypothetical protein CHM34_15895 [Paludifilum halophilum]|uniref:Uncharacterized protein n=1 Tax=Paludifilum halophilum TaxID=1642702 RepID=A0A235B2R6_9BACL|nr:hypothetical protein CHM34_15895 [Paludifilum halophilum]